MAAADAAAAQAVNPRFTIAALAVAAALAALLWYDRGYLEAQREAAETAEARLFAGFAAADIHTLELPLEGDGRARLVRGAGDGAGGWRLHAPLDAPADAEVADALAGAFARLESENSFEAKEPLSAYGIGASADGGKTWRAETSAGKTLLLRAGNEAPVGGGIYASTGAGAAGRVWRVQSWRLDALKKPLRELRDKRVLHFNAGNVRALRVRWPGGGAAFARTASDSAEGAGWRFAKGGFARRPHARAKVRAAAVSQLLDALQNLRAAEFVDRPDARQRARLKAPAYRVQFMLAGESKARRFALAAAADAATVAAAPLVQGREGRVFEIAAAQVGKWPKTLAAFESFEVARFAPDAVARLQLHFQNGGETLQLELQAEGESEFAPAAGRADADAEDLPAPGRAAELAAALSRLDAPRLIAEAPAAAALKEYGLAPPNARFRALAADGAVLADVRLGAAQADEMLPVMASDGAVFALPAAELPAALPRDLAHYRADFRAPAPAAAAGADA